VNQPLSLVEQLKKLEQLQELDLKIDRIRKDQKILPAALKTAEEALKKVRAALTLKHSQLAELEKVGRQTQAAVDLNQERLSRSGAKLESVQNTQEFQAASKELEQLKKLALSLEEQKKKSTSDLETAQKDLVAIQQEVEKLDSEHGRQSESLLGQNQALGTDLNQLLSERTQFLVGVETRIVSQYDRIRIARGGVGIVPAVGGRCRACNMMVPPQVFIELQRGSVLHQCPSCNRILFAPSTPKENVGALG
jgi:hypothetical protein